ncbi:unnamed protein product [Rotaria magnacalcarata]|uniref:Tetratricopeptide repeat protein n=1 Tax=Rotaria magnacalcarata TaxID=392030 RepID=A0A816LKU7_9BILA|nr:unnamed protein product [Rotaria magnacalcarata]
MFPSNHPDLTTSYNNIGLVYDKIGEYSKALSSYERSFEIKKITLLLNHPGFAQSYINIDDVYRNMGEYSKALFYYEMAHDILQILPSPTHRDMALLKKNIQNVKEKFDCFYFATKNASSSLSVNWRAKSPWLRSTTEASEKSTA